MLRLDFKQHSSGCTLTLAEHSHDRLKLVESEHDGELAPPAIFRKNVDKGAIVCQKNNNAW